MPYIDVGEFTAVDQVSEEVIKREGPLPVSITFDASVGEVSVQWFKNKEFRTIPGAVFTTDTADAVENARPGDRIRLKCTSFTSGPIPFTLG